jgi:hypothetical protein
MGAKLIRNNTEYFLHATLLVRRGDQPGRIADSVHRDIPSFTTEFVDYGANPYLDVIEVEAIDAEGILGATVRVTSRGSTEDRQLNTNDSVDFDLYDNQLAISCHNSADDY